MEKEDDNMIYFTSDLHLGHRGIIEMQNRPFENIQEMNQVLIRNYNAVVHKNDTVYILGDISHHLPRDRANELISKLNGKKILVKGNHDKKYDTELFEEICDFKTVSLNGVYFALMHYPMLSWPKKNSGSIQLHGHIHAREEYNLQNKVDGITRYDVGVDANCYYPVSVKQIIKFFENNEGKCKL
ncbi:metallophosphoesterase [Dorea formicigenerans]|uniref:Ser/Thr phosphatase family protein n=1 Tax=Dorea formicigenerans ATCC 27755 TaxID=411461 RepID=B0G1T3_9FIRM|nr:metallophosphoesterase [Dorea formicigenerans]EDR48451.1 Ser/Thr phosphatase family protein [Dorea formicigenerans ATCC 27755]UWP20886.1 metallophosphoesterase [Dorea formicigenerans]